ncbi:MAG: hypothetical protein A2081_02640 [Elusimicrobia bacterium GWC2_61_19]|nr:MAG: hypothetical protein A2081_02640 [Elusimicrobia bacterium GWC2_61_19]
MFDYNTKKLVLWVLKEFRAQLLLAAAGALAAGYAFGCFSKTHVSNNALVSVFDLNAAPARYNTRNICVRGTILNLKDAGAEPSDLPYAIFSLKETRTAGDYDFVNIISFKEREAAPSGLVLACGVFSELKQVGKDTYHNVLFLNRFQSQESGKLQGPLRGPRRSRAF